MATIAEFLAGKPPNIYFRGKVTGVEQRQASGWNIHDLTLQDETGVISMALFNPDITFNVGDFLNATKCYVKEYKGTKQLANMKESVVTKVGGPAPNPFSKENLRGMQTAEQIFGYPPYDKKENGGNTGSSNGNTGSNGGNNTPTPSSGGGGDNGGISTEQFLILVEKLENLDDTVGNSLSAIHKLLKENHVLLMKQLRINAGITQVEPETEDKEKKKSKKKD